MPYKLQIAHDRRTGEYFLAHVMYRNESEWFAIQRVGELDKEVQDALSEPILEHTGTDESEPDET